MIYVIGLARYSSEGTGRTNANIVTNELVLFKNKRVSIQYLVLQFLLLSGAVYLMEIAIGIGHADRSPSVSFAPEGPMTWRTFGLFVYACGFVLVWNASLHLLAQYAKAIGICGDGDKLKNCKDKNVFTQESAVAWLTGGRRARPLSV